MGRGLPQLLTAMTLSAMLMGGCAVPAPQRGGLGQGPAGGGGATPRSVYGGSPAAPGPVSAGTVPGGGGMGTYGGGAGAAGLAGVGAGAGGGAGGAAGLAGGAGAESGRTPPAPAPELGQRISNYVAGLDVINGGTNTGMWPLAGGYGGGGGAGAGQIGAGRDMSTDMAGADTSRIGRGVGVSTMVVGNRAFIGIDPATIGLGRSMGGTPASVTGDARGAAGAGLEGFLRGRVRSEFPEVTEVYVTTDPALVSQIARVTTAGHAGFDADIVQIIRRLAPASSSPR